MVSSSDPRVEPPPAEHHRQLVHPAQQARGLPVRELLLPRRLRFGQILVDLFVGESPPALDRAFEHVGRHPHAVGGHLDHGRQMA